MAGFCKLVVRLQTPNFVTSRDKSPIVSGEYLKYSRFWETGLETRFDLHCLAELAVECSQFSAVATGSWE
jgi:hypothetical protein